MNPDTLRAELLALEAEDLRVRAELFQQGAPAQGYHPTMEAVHRTNAVRLREIIDHAGWPGRQLVGEDGARAAWLIAQHAIGEPDFQRRCLVLLKQSAARGDVPAHQPAYLEDRIRVFEGRGQLYGTQFEPDAEGNSVPSLIEDPEHLEERRRTVGLRPLADQPPQTSQSDANSPEIRQKVEREWEEWLRRVGWRS
jgi:hypothetical protein